MYGGKLALNPWAEGFHDPDVYARASRTAIAVTRDHRLMFVTIHRHIYLSQLAGVMKGLGAEYALNLDGGSSSAMYWNGSVITTPARRLTNILTICPVRTRVAAHPHQEPVDLPTPSFDWGLEAVPVSLFSTIF
ncbi:MAG: phosphodiester glycosidase family protein [Candidatus Xenobia bacterium]